MFFFFSSRRRHTRLQGDWSSDVCSSDLVGLAEVLRATEYVVPAIEIVDARLQDPRKIFDTVSDNGAAAGIVIGGRPGGAPGIHLPRGGGGMYCNLGNEGDRGAPRGRGPPPPGGPRRAPKPRPPGGPP